MGLPWQDTGERVRGVCPGGLDRAGRVRARIADDMPDQRHVRALGGLVVRDKMRAAKAIGLVNLLSGTLATVLIHSVKSRTSAPAAGSTRSWSTSIVRGGHSSGVWRMSL